MQPNLERASLGLQHPKYTFTLQSESSIEWIVVESLFRTNYLPTAAHTPSENMM
ncbi:MAG: hypothetical protein ACTS44_01875 [Candidatus Hodgkinia cicadicola]